YPTPRAEETTSDRMRNGKPNLQGVARLMAGGLTPRARCDSGLTPITAAHGATRSGCHAPTEKCGVLNPDLSLWLMGYPDAWLSCGVRAMQSFQSSRRVS